MLSLYANLFRSRCWATFSPLLLVIAERMTLLQSARGTSASAGRRLHLQRRLRHIPDADCQSVHLADCDRQIHDFPLIECCDYYFAVPICDASPRDTNDRLGPRKGGTLTCS